VLDAVVRIHADPERAGLGDQAPAVKELLDEPLADDLTRGQAMRLAALLHDAAKPLTRDTLPDGRVTFIGHDKEGAELARGILARLRSSEKLRDYVAGLTRHHLALGFLVHERPVSRRAAWRYLRATAPYAADVTILTVADRLATRGRNARPAIEAHLGLAREMLELAFAERDAGPQPPLLRGDELARELDLTPGPQLGELLAQLEEDRYAGEIATREQALARARELTK
jgi:poly(A) polymerase